MWFLAVDEAAWLNSDLFLALKGKTFLISASTVPTAGNRKKAKAQTTSIQNGKLLLIAATEQLKHWQQSLSLFIFKHSLIINNSQEMHTAVN